MGRPSEDPVLLAKIQFLSFFYDIEGDKNTLETLSNRIDWRQFCDLKRDAPLPERTTLVNFRRKVGLAVIEGMFRDFLQALAKESLLDLNHRFFDGTPAKARARINPYRDEIYQETLAGIEEKLASFKAEQVKLDPCLNTTPVKLEKTSYAADNREVEARRKEKLKPVAQRMSNGDKDARFQRSKHGKGSVLGDEVFFSTDGKEFFIEDVLVSSKACAGQQLFLEKLEESQEGQIWSVDAEFAAGEILAKAEEKKVILNTPGRSVNSHGVFGKTEFEYDAGTNTYTCPNKQKLSHTGTNHKNGERHYRPAKGTCDKCPLREQCTRSKTGRTVTRNRYEEQWERQREHAHTPEAVMGKVLRGIIAEGKFAQAVRHGLKTMRYVGKKMALMQSKLVALILNVKRLLRLEQRQGLLIT